MSTITIPAGRARFSLAARYGASVPQVIAMLLVAIFLVAFLIVPIVRVFVVAFTLPEGGFTLVHFGDFFRTRLLREAFWNSLYVATMTVVLASLIAVPLATILSRFRFPGAALIHTLGVVPLVMPPFVGAVAMQLIFGRNGSINLLMMEWFGFRIPFMEGLNGVIFVEALHYFPFILLNLSASLSNIDSAMEESAQNLGAHGFTLFSRIVFPLALPGYIAGAALVFVKVFDDLATPLLLNVNNMLAPQAYLKITSVGITDPMGYVISVIMVLCSVGGLALSGLFLKGRDFSTQQRGGGGLSQRELRPGARMAAIAFVIFAVLLALSPHVGIFLLSIATVWSYAILPDAFTLSHYQTIFREAGPLISNTVLYCGLAGLIDIVLGATVAYIVLRTRLPGRRLVEQVAMSAVAIPGLVLGIGLLRTYYDFNLPFSNQSLATFWGMLVIAYAVRRLPYALSAATASLRQVHLSLEEAAESLGAGKFTTLRRVVVPLMTGGLLAGFVTSFATAAVELSATLMLVTNAADAPLSYGIYVYMQSAAGRGPGAALGVIAVVVVAIATFISYRIAEHERSLKARVGAFS
ncbi:MAG: iron ABC transporter permease [Hyphomicrobiales bacterium]|nr:iron ABC transporter permease [Hyphomicrobiales bacterium]